MDRKQAIIARDRVEGREVVSEGICTANFVDTRKGLYAAPQPGGLVLHEGK